MRVTGVASQAVKVLPVGVPTRLPGLDVEVTLMDANHCPGAVMWLFRVMSKLDPSNDKYYLHVGERACSACACCCRGRALFVACVCVRLQAISVGAGR